MNLNECGGERSFLLARISIRDSGFVIKKSGIRIFYNEKFPLRSKKDERDCELDVNPQCIID
jgi:hypothetical protein